MKIKFNNYFLFAKSKKRWSALIVTIFIVMVLVSMMIYLIEQIIPTTRSVKWIENSTVAYYQGISWIEEALFSMSWSNPWLESSALPDVTVPKTFAYTITASGHTIPTPWDWNSWYDHDWNIIWFGQPIQLVLDEWIDWNMISFHFRVPNISSTETLSLEWWSLPIINWILSWSGNILYSSWSQIKANDVSDSSVNPTPPIFLDSKNWFDINWTTWTIKEFYRSTIGSNFTDVLWNWLSTTPSGDGQSCSWNKCTLKLSLINDLITTIWTRLPYLEYKIELDWTNPTAPLQYATIRADGYSYWFKRSLKRDIQQLTTNEALDFTVFQ